VHGLTAVEQAAAIRDGGLSPVEAVEHHLDRIDRTAGLHAFVTVTAERARELAKAAEVAVTLREPGDPGLPPLHGVPVAVKDLADTAGVRTAYGSLAFADHLPDTDAEPVRRLAAAGTISLGKTATSEFGATLYTETRIHPPTRNPWHPALTPGGSSGGAAAAVAAGLVPVAHGSDGGGSLRIPAALCGLVGYKPTRRTPTGRRRGGGAGPVHLAGDGGLPGVEDGFGLAAQGAIGRTVADVAALATALGVPNLHDVNNDGGPGGRPVRVGRYLTPALAEVAVHPDCVAAWEAASRALEALGCEVVDVAGPFTPELLPDFRTLWACLLARVPVPADRRADLLPLTRWLVELGEDQGPDAVSAARRRLGAAARRAVVGGATGAVGPAGGVAAVGVGGERCDLVLTPTVAVPVAVVGAFSRLGPAEDFAAQTAFSPYCSVYNLTGQPAVSVPVGETVGDGVLPGGLPVGVQLAAGAGWDGLLLAVAARLAEVFGWARRHPPGWSGLPSATVGA
jgi:amidase